MAPGIHGLDPEAPVVREKGYRQVPGGADPQVPAPGEELGQEPRTVSRNARSETR
jgi:hypothetical protein